MGHTHHPKDVTKRGLRYLNCGDWVDSCTCVVETTDGELVLCRWNAATKMLDRLKTKMPLFPDGTGT